MSNSQPHIDTHLDLSAVEALQAWLTAKFGDKVLESTLAVRELTIRVAPAKLLAVMQRLRDDKTTQFTQLIDVCGVDWLGQRPATERFDVVYHLLSLTKNLRLRVKVATGNFAANAAGASGLDTHGVPSLVGLYPAANWFERETWDMFGIPFTCHPDLRRILTDYDFSGHPLRKDFPLEGFVETYYDSTEKRVAYKPVDLPQEFRHFDKVSEWRGMTGNATLAEEDNRLSNTFNPDEFR